MHTSMRTSALLYLFCEQQIVYGRSALRSPTADEAKLPPAAGENITCVEDPSLCLPHQSCKYDFASCGDSVNARHLEINTTCTGSCVDVSSKNTTECFRYPGTEHFHDCFPGGWCMFEDHSSWGEVDHGTRGTCVRYQGLCMSCSRTASDGPSGSKGLWKYNGLTLWNFDEGDAGQGSYSPGSGTGSRGGRNEYGNYISRQLICDPAQSVCTGDVIPSLPPTCVQTRQPYLKNNVTVPILRGWIQRLLRMGARTYDQPRANFSVSASFQDPQGTSREELHKGINQLMKALWPTSALGHGWPGKQVPVDYDVETGKSLLCCSWTNYSASLSAFQAARGGVNYRNPLAPRAPEQANPPPCVQCEYDGSFNDENPAIWSVLHYLSFNLPATITESQYSALRALPLWLREHLSSGLGRSNVQEFFIRDGIPTSRNGFVWGWYFWRAHNYVNEQSQVTRCGAQNCNYGSFMNIDLQWQCPGVYKYPWFVKFEDAVATWKVGAVEP